MSIFRVNDVKNSVLDKEIIVSVKMNGQAVNMEVDTWAAVSLISEIKKNFVIPNVPMEKP